jgi:hypothetical protein
VYVGNNPVNYVDPTGHNRAVPTNEGSCEGCGTPEPVTIVETWGDTGGNKWGRTSNGDIVLLEKGEKKPVPCVNPNYAAIVRGEIPKGLPDADFLMLTISGGPISGAGVIIDRNGTVWKTAGLGGDASPSGAVVGGWILGDDKDVSSFLEGAGQSTTITVVYLTAGWAESSDGRIAILLGGNSVLLDVTYSESYTGR